MPRIEVTAPRFNADRTIELLRRGNDQNVGLTVFPELGISSDAIDDLLQQDALLDAVQATIARLVEASGELFPAFAVGTPLRLDGRLLPLSLGNFPLGLDRGLKASFWRNAIPLNRSLELRVGAGPLAGRTAERGTLQGSDSEGSLHEARAKKIQRGAPVHLAFEELEPVVLAFHLT